jgi:hypothetical protein
MQKKGLISLVALTALVVAGAAFLSVGKPEAVVEAGAGETVLPDLAAHLGYAAWLELSHGKTKITFVRQAAGKPEAGKSDATTSDVGKEDAGKTEAERWVVAEKDGYAADIGKIHEALLGLAQLKLVEAKTRKPELYARLELEDPAGAEAKSVLARIKDEKGLSLGEIIVGKHRPDRLGSGNDGTYLRRPNDPQTWLAQGSADLSGETAEWLEKKIAALPATRFKQVVITQPDGTRLTLVRDKAEEDLKVSDAPADAKYTGQYLRTQIPGVFDGLELADVKAASSFEMPKDGVVHTEWTGFDGLTVAAAIADKDGAHWVKLSATGTDKAKEEADRLTAQWAPWVYAVPDFKANAMNAKRSDLIEAPKPS